MPIEAPAVDVSLFDPATLRWAFGLIIGFPLLMIVLGELAFRLRRRGTALADSVFLLRNLVLPAFAVWLLLEQVVGLPHESVPARLALTALWLSLIHAALEFVDDVVFSSAADHDDWRARVPKLLLQLVRLVLVVVGFAVILSTVWGVDLTSWLAALGIGSIVIGLALQEPLGNVFAGLMLLLERPASLGDWVEVDGARGRVVEINWRSVHVETPTREILVVPNSNLNKGSFRNLSRPTPVRTEQLTLGFSYDDPPNKVRAVLLDLLRSTPGVLADPAPLVRTLAYADFSINYLVIFSAESQEAMHGLRDQVLTRLWYAARRHGLTIPYPIQTEIQVSREEMTQPGPQPDELAAAFPHWFSEKALGDSDLHADLASQFQLHEYSAGERVLRLAAAADGLHLILRGTAALSTLDRDGIEREIGRIGRGEYFGEGSITGGQGADVAVTAVEDLETLVLSPELVQSLMLRLPRLGRELGGVIDQRRQAVQLARRGPRGERRRDPARAGATPLGGSSSTPTAPPR
jgi:small-conductance mechanosensitive channel/CRP-like cAMP-binding protein